MERMEDRDIRREIDEKLHAIEEKEHVRILYAVESGSRAWGLASPDSDYDVRFLYVRPMEEYLRLDSPRDVIEWQLDEVLDTLTEREQKVLRLRFGMNDGRARTLEEVGKEFDVTRERIRQIEAKALRKLRHPSRSRKLRDYLD